MKDRHGGVYMWFRYNVMRIWEQPVDDVLAAGLTVLPLAPVSRVAPERVRDVLEAISTRLTRETSPEQRATIWGATEVLMGLYYSLEQVATFTEGISAMVLGIRGIEESSVYQDIFGKGRLEGRIEDAKQVLLDLGQTKFGQPGEQVETVIAAMNDIGRLHALLKKVLNASSWDELLTPTDPSV